MRTPEAFLTRYAENPDAHRLDATLAMIAEEAVYLFSDGSAHVGKAAIAKVLAANFAAIAKETYRLVDIRWLLQTADAAVSIYRFEWTGEIDGKPVSGGGRGTSVLRREGDDWLVMHEHLSRGGLG